MDKVIRNLAIGLSILILLVPLGLLAGGETFGEWANEELQEKLGFAPSRLEQLSSLWRAPISDYAFPDNQESSKGLVAAYYVSAIIGALICAGLLYFVGKRISKTH